MSETTLVVGNCNYSSWSLRAWLALRKAGAEFSLLRLPLDTPEFRQRIGEYSPTGRVPVLHHGARVVWDSLAIAEYANETFAGGRLWPADPDARALARSASAEMHSGFAALRAALPMNLRAEGRRVAADAAVEADIRRIGALWNHGLERFGGPWLVGDYCIADAMFAPVASRLRTYGVELAGAAAGYREQHLADPDFQLWARWAAAEPEVVAAEEVGHGGPRP